MCYCTVFAFINFEFEDNFQQPLLGLELCKQQYIVSDTFWLQSLGTICNGSFANAKIYVSLGSFRFFKFWIWGQFPSTSPQGLVFGGAIHRRVFCVTSLGGLFKGAYFRNFTVSGYVWKEPCSHDQMFIISGLLVSDTFAWSREVSLFSISWTAVFYKNK